MNEWEVNNRNEGQKIAEDTKSRYLRSFFVACIIFSLALTIRLTYLCEISANPTFQVPIVDSKTYDETARSLVAGQGLVSNFFWQPFFYPFFLSVVYFFSGGSIIAAKVIQVLLGASTCALTYRLGEKIFGGRTGIIAGLITAFYGPMFFYESELLATVLETFWVIVIILLFLKAKEQDKGWHWFFLGLCGALGIITRPTLLPFFFAGCIWLRLLVRQELSLMTRFGLLFAGFALVAAPVGAATMYAVGKFSILPTSSGINLYIGNNPNRCQTLTIRPGGDWERLTKLPSQYGMGKTALDEDRFFKQQVIEYVKKQPLDFIKGLGHKTLEFICSREIPRNISIYIFGRWSRLLRLLMWKAGGFGFPLGVIFPLAVLGVIFNWRRIPAPVILFVVLYPLSVILFFVASRYKVPMVPILAILAAAGLVSAVKRVRLKQWREVMIVAAVVVGTILLSTLPGPFCQEQVDFEPEFFKFVGDGMVKRGLNDKAMECLSEALRLKPDYNETYFYMGEALRGQGKVSEAIEYYRKALQVKLDDSIEYIAYNNLGMALMKQGKMDEAIEQYKEAIRLKPDYPIVHNNLGIALENQGKMDEAIEQYREALRLKPDFPEVRENLASALALLRQSKDRVQP
jgi:4-amino-4-deoxy-L-arabinose transferase-like glycosyltransferase/predicted negative regulator of RcsB-dependent stress response